MRTTTIASVKHVIVCLDCRRVTPRHRSGRCPACRRARERARDRHPARRAVKAERYDAEHRMLRTMWAPVVATGATVCARAVLDQCLHDDPVITPDDQWHLDHLPDGTRAPSHRLCNESARSNAGAA